MMKGMAKNRKGTVIVMFAILLTVLIGLVALGIEVGTWYLTQAELAKAVDGAALAGAANIAAANIINLPQLADDFGYANFGVGYLGTPTTGSGEATFTTTTSTGQNNTTLFSVAGSVTKAGILSQLFGANSISVSASGTAQKSRVQIVMVLDASASMSTAASNLTAAAKSFLGYFTSSQAQDMMALITFGTVATVQVALETNFASDIQAGINAYSGTIPATNTVDAVTKAGLQLPDQTGVPNAQKWQQFIVFFTDGYPTAFTSNFYHSNTWYNNYVVVCTTDNCTDVQTDLYDSTGTKTSVNAVQTGLGQNETTCRTGSGTQNNPYVYSTSWATPFAAVAPPSPYTTVDYCDLNIKPTPPPRTVLANYIHTGCEQMAVNTATALKNRGVMIYTILLTGDGPTDSTFLSNMSSGSGFAYVTPDSTQLQAIFNQIAKAIALQLVK